jgi:hypothetical protein
MFSGVQPPSPGRRALPPDPHRRGWCSSGGCVSTHAPARPCGVAASGACQPAHRSSSRGITRQNLAWPGPRPVHLVGAPTQSDTRVPNLTPAHPCGRHRPNSRAQPRTCPPSVGHRPIRNSPSQRSHPPHACEHRPSELTCQPPHLLASVGHRPIRNSRSQRSHPPMPAGITRHNSRAQPPYLPILVGTACQKRTFHPTHLPVFVGCPASRTCVPRPPLWTPLLPTPRPVRSCGTTQQTLCSHPSHPSVFVGATHQIRTFQPSHPPPLSGATHPNQWPTSPATYQTPAVPSSHTAGPAGSNPSKTGVSNCHAPAHPPGRHHRKPAFQLSRPDRPRRPTLQSACPCGAPIRGRRSLICSSSWAPPIESAFLGPHTCAFR